MVKHTTLENFNFIAIAGTVSQRKSAELVYDGFTEIKKFDMESKTEQFLNRAF